MVRNRFYTVATASQLCIIIERNRRFRLVVDIDAEFISSSAATNRVTGAETFARLFSTVLLRVATVKQQAVLAARNR